MRYFASASIQGGVRSRQDNVLSESSLSMDTLPYEPGDTYECAGSIILQRRRRRFLANGSVAAMFFRLYRSALITYAARAVGTLLLPSIVASPLTMCGSAMLRWEIVHMAMRAACC